MKKIISAVLAVMMLLSYITALAAETDRAILLCYNGEGKLVYSALMKKGEYTSIPPEYESAEKKVYDVDGEKFMTIEEYDAVSGATATAAPEATEEPAQTAAPTATPKATATPKPAAASTADTPYEKAADGVYAPALVTNIVQSANTDDEEVYTLTVYYQGHEVTVDIEEDLAISTAPAEYAEIKGQTAGALKKGDVICMTANIAGTRIKELDFITRPVREDIVTNNTNYGADFEDLFAANGKVAGKWNYQKYGSGVTNDKYSFAYGLVADVNANTLTLLNKSGVTDDALEIDLAGNAYVYSCDVSAKDYDFELGGIYDIETTIPSSELREDKVELDDSYSYNYALVRLVEGTATDIVLFNNYNY